ncbi:MAG: MATE family efflux transporter [Eubacteriales bacterium]|nr:MATE family efflux transporter [Eubacteriales bacterium]
MRVRNMTEGSPIRLILSVALPLMLGNIFQQLYTVVDAQVVGSVLGVHALAALGSSDWLNWMFLGLIHGFSQGFTIPMAQAFGAGDHDALRRYIGNSVVLSLLTCLATTAVALLTLSPILDLMGNPQEIRPMTTTYLRILFAGYPISMAYNLMAGVLRSLGDGRTPLYAMVMASLLNIALDYLFVAVFGWGVGGAAIATVIAQAAAFVFCLFALSRIPFIRPKKKDLRLEKAASVRLMRLGIPLAAQNAIIGVGGMIVQSVVNTMGVTFIAGYTATNKLYGVLEIAAVSYGYATSTYTGQNMGAGRIDRIRKGVRAANITGCLTAAAIALFMALFGKSIISTFLSGSPQEVEEAMRIACEFLWTMSVTLPVLYILHIVRSALQGMGNTFMPMLSGIAEFFMRTGSALLLPALVGYRGLFWAEVLAWAGADVILLASYFRTMRDLAPRRE